MKSVAIKLLLTLGALATTDLACTEATKGARTHFNANTD